MCCRLRHCEERSDEAIQKSIYTQIMDCFAEFTLSKTNVPQWQKECQPHIKVKTFIKDNNGKAVL